MLTEPRDRYDEEILILRRQVETSRGGGAPPPQGMQGPPQHGGPSNGPPPAINVGNNLFSGIMTGQGGQGGGLPPQPVPQEQQAQGQHHQMPQGPPGLQGPPPPSSGQQPPFQPPYQQGPAPNGFPSQGPSSTASPGPGKRGLGRPPAGGPATPQINTPMPYPGPGASPQVANHPTPDHRAMQPHPGAGMMNNALGEVDLERLPPHFKKTRDDWFVVFNQQVPRTLDVDLVHTLSHDSVVCCVRFSHDGKFIATGCNRSAQIYDVNTGEKLCVLQDENADVSGDLYIRSVCFSPDGKYLATGAEDKLIRVWDIQNRTIRNTFAGHEQDIYSLDFARDGRTIASGSGDRTVRLWDIETGSAMLTLSIEDGVTTVAISPDTKYVAAGSLDKSVRVWDIKGGYLLERLEGPEGHKDSVYSVAFSPNGKDLVSGSLDKTIKMWELSTPRGMQVPNPKGGRCVKTFEGHRVGLCCFFTSPLQTFLGLTLFFLLYRISSCRSHSHLMLNGFFPVPRTVACSSGIPGQVTRSLCCRATRTRSSRSHPALLEHSSPPVLVILVPVSGRTEPSHSRKRSVCGARRRKERAQKARCRRSDVGCRWLVRAASSWHCVILELGRLCFYEWGGASVQPRSGRSFWMK